MHLKKYEILCLSCLFAAGVACGANTAVQETFETKSVNDGLSEVSTAGAAWDGYGTIVETTENYYENPNGVGTPVQDEGVTHTKALQVDDYVRLKPSAPTTEEQPVQVDMMVQAALPDEKLAIPESEKGEDETTGIQIAVGVDRKDGSTDSGELKVYCKSKKEDEVGWYLLKDVVKDRWYRVSFIFDYTKALCQVRVDGSPVVTAEGYLAADTTKSDGNGSWYKLVDTSTTTQLTSVKVIGTTSLDDVVVKSEPASAEGALPVLPGSDTEVSFKTAEGDSAATVQIPVSWFADNGAAIPTDAKDTAVVAPDNSGMTVANKYLAGLKPTDGEKFKIKSMTMEEGTGDNAGKVKVTLEIPKITPPPGQTIELVYGPDPSCTGENARSTEITKDTGTSLPIHIDKRTGANRVFYYRLKSSPDPQ